jgi:hypothetical protein
MDSTDADIGYISLTPHAESLQQHPHLSLSKVLLFFCPMNPFGPSLLLDGLFHRAQLPNTCRSLSPLANL